MIRPTSRNKFEKFYYLRFFHRLRLGTGRTLMNTIFAQHHQVAPDAPFEVMQSAIQRLTTSTHERLEDIGRQFRTVHSIEEAHQRQLRELLGDSGYDDLRALREQPTALPVGPGKQPTSPTDVMARRADHQRRVRELLAELKVSPDRVPCPEQGISPTSCKYD